MSRSLTSWLLLASTMPLVLMACGSSSPDAAASTSSLAPARPAVNEQSTTSALSTARERLEQTRANALPSGDCTLLSEAALRRHFPSAPADMETRVRAKPYPSCTYLWATATPDKRTMAGRIVETPGEGRVTLTVAAVRDPESDWQRVLSSYRTVPPVTVDGIGDRAVWSDQRHQLSVLVPGFVAHVAVEDDDNPGSGREQAIALARDVLANLR